MTTKTTTKTPKNKANSSRLEKLHEIVSGGSVKVERESGIIHEVKVLGRTSRNGRTYAESAVRSSVPMYEGAKVEINHDRSGGERPFEAMFGELRSVRVREGELFADLHYNRSHALAESIIEAAERFPKQFGLSHNATGRTTRKGGETIVEEITAVDSVDIVSRPATNAGLFESHQAMPKTITLTEFVATLPANHKGLAALKLFEDEFGGAVMEAPAEGESVGADEQVKSAFRSMVMAAFDDEALDSKATIAKIKDILKAQDKLMGKAEKADDSEPETSDEATAESVQKKKDDDAMSAKILESLEKVNQRLAAVEAKDAAAAKLAAVSKLAADANVEVGSALLESLAKIDEASAKAVIDGLPKKAAPKGDKPAMHSRFQESASAATGSYDDQTKNGFAVGLK